MNAHQFTKLVDDCQALSQIDEDEPQITYEIGASKASLLLL